MCENVRGDLEALSFAMDEVRLFLDTHPTNTCALKAYQELHTQRDAAVKAYEAAVGPVDFLQCRRKKMPGTGCRARGPGKRRRELCGAMKNGCNFPSISKAECSRGKSDYQPVRRAGRRAGRLHALSLPALYHEGQARGRPADRHRDRRAGPSGDGERHCVPADKGAHGRRNQKAGVRRLFCQFRRWRRATSSSMGIPMCARRRTKGPIIF